MTSSEIKNKQAFPDEAQYGMTYHQWLVGKIAAGIVDGFWHDGSYDAAAIAEHAVRVADEICKRLEEGTPR